MLTFFIVVGVCFLYYLTLPTERDIIENREIADSLKKSMRNHFYYNGEDL